jgi:capsular polysaccharide export protein
MQAFDASVAFISFVRFRQRSYSDSDEVATIALTASKHIPRSPFWYRLKWLMFRCQYNWSRNYFEYHTDTVALCWNGLSGSRRAFVEGAKRAGAATVLFELAPLPGRITIDAKGVNFVNSLPRNSQFYTNWRAAHPEHKDAWMDVRDRIISRQGTKNKNVKQELSTDDSLERPYLFVPLQVQNDSQIRLFGGHVTSVDHFVRLLDQAADKLPEGWTLRVKEHPTSPIPYRLEKIIQQRSRWVIDNITDTLQLIKSSEGVITINSSVGLEAMFFAKPVLVLGQAFYGFDRIANTVKSLEELANIFANPLQRLIFEPQPVAAFLSYLSSVYYCRVELDCNVVRGIPPEWLNEFKVKLKQQ